MKTIIEKENWFRLILTATFLMICVVAEKVRYTDTILVLVTNGNITSLSVIVYYSWYLY